ADVEVQAGAVAEEDVAAAPPADDLAEQVARDLVGAQPPLALERARHAVLVLDPEDPPVHEPSLRCGPRPIGPDWSMPVSRSWPNNHRRAGRGPTMRG